MSNSESLSPRALVEKWYNSLSTMDLESFSATLSEDFINNVGGCTPISGRSYGKKQLFEEIFPKVVKNLEPASINLARRYRIMAVDGNMVVGMMEGGAKTLDGKDYDQKYCQIFRIENGLISEIWEFFDTMQVEVRLFGREIDPGNPPSDPLRF